MKVALFLLVLYLQIHLLHFEKLNNENNEEENNSEDEGGDQRYTKIKEFYSQNLESILETFKKLVVKYPNKAAFHSMDVKQFREGSSKTKILLQEFLDSYRQTDKRRNVKQPDEDTIIQALKYSRGKSILSNPQGNKVEGYTLLLESAIDGSMRAKEVVAWEFLFGFNLPQNIEISKGLFEELAEDGEPSGHTGMAFLYSIGLGVSYDPGRALVHFTVGALGGSGQAKMSLAYRYWSGIGVRASCEKALQLYTMVAEDVVSEFEQNGGMALSGMALVGMPLSKRSLMEEADNGYQSSTEVDVKDYLVLMAENGDVSAQIKLGKMYYTGDYTLPRDLRMAFHYFKLAALYDHPEANAFLGNILLEGGGGVDVDLPTAYIYLKRAADQENPIGETGLGKMCLKGKHVAKDYLEALHYFTKAANRGWSDAMIQLGKMYFMGLGVERDFDSAKKYFLAAGQSAHILSYYYLGQMYGNGVGTMRTCVTAVELLKVVCERGKWKSLFTDAYTMYNAGKMNEAFVMYAVLSELGYSFGQTNAAFILNEKNIELPLNLESGTSSNDWRRQRKALQYWSRVALQGYPIAILKIGDHHYYGLGTQQDYVAATGYYKMAADQYKIPQAMYNVGFMYEHGLGVEKDLSMARSFYNMAMKVSNDAWVLVALVLFKLTIVEVISSFLSGMREFNLKQVDLSFGKNWDLFAILFLVLILARLISLRRLNRELYLGFGVFQFIM